MHPSVDGGSPLTLAVVVNYHSAWLCLEAVRSIIAAETIGPIHVVVVDNSVDGKEARLLREGLPEGVSLIVNPENRGFGAACNQALSGYDPDMIFLLNPDAVIDPQCLIRLQRCLTSHPGVGAVSPQIYWDPARRFLLPPSLPPEVMGLQRMLTPYPVLSRWLCRLWRGYAIRVWRGTKPLRVWNLSGGHVLLDAEAVRRAGGLFDERFFLYYEDSDLFLRLRRTGYGLMVEPRAIVIHGYDRCARHELPQKRRWMAASADRFWEKHGDRVFGVRMCHARMPVLMRRGLFRVDRLAALVLGNTAETSEPDRMVRTPFSIPVPLGLSAGWLFEWSPNENFLPAAGCFGSGNRLRVTDEDVVWLSPGGYVGRIGGARAWQWPKTCFRMEKEG